jgi:uncharacterized membrane protein
MQSKVRLLGHPLHTILVDFPVAIFPLMVGLDILWRTQRGVEGYFLAAGWIGAAGALLALAAIVTGTIDLAFIPDGSRAHRVAAVHFGVGLGVLALYVASLVLRWPLDAPRSTNLVLLVDLFGLAAVVVQGFLGGELVNRHQIGVRSVEEGADPVVLARK